MGQGKNKFEVKCLLAFADDIALITENQAHATVMLDLLHETAEKTGLKYLTKKQNI